MIAVFQKELKTYFSTMIGYVFIAVLLLITGLLCYSSNLYEGYAGLEYSLAVVSYIFLLIVPILTMSTFADERKNKTDQLLSSLPISAGQIVVGKFLALMTVFSVSIGVMCVYPLILSLYGQVNFLATYAAILGFFLLGGALLAFGLMISSLTESPVIAAVVGFFSLLFLYLLGYFASLIPAGAFASLVAFVLLSAAVCALIYYVTKNALLPSVLFVIAACALCALYHFKSAVFEGSFAAMLHLLCVYDRYATFTGGIFDLSAIVYYLSVCALCLFFAVRIIDRRRWN